MPLNRQVVTHLPTGPSESDRIFNEEANAIGPQALSEAANPRVAALHGVLSDLTGIPSTVDAIRSAKLGPAAVGIAGFLPIGRIGRSVKAAADVVRGVEEGSAAFRVPRTAEQVAQHVEQASKNALAEGHGMPGSGGIGKVPKLKPGEVTPETGGETGTQVREALKGTKEGVPGAAEMRSAQTEIQSEARGERASAAKVAEIKAGGGLAGHAAAREAMRGELPKIHWNNKMVDLNQETLDQMAHFVQNHPGLRVYEQNKTIDALEKMAQGGIPAAHEQRLLERAFGKETAGQLSQLAKNGGWKNLSIDVLNVPRAVMASTDLSAPLRQGLVAGVTHPVMTAKNLGPMLKMAKSEDFFKNVQDSIHADPLYPLMHKAGLALTDIGEKPGGAASLGAREEARMSNLAERIPGIGRVIRGSDRAYVGFLNKTRADYFKRLVMQAAQQGHDVNDEKLIQSIAKVVNTATGRGNVPQALQDHLATMNALFFSPRLLASRLNLLNPIYYAKLDPFARREALRAFVSMGAMAITTLELAKLAGAQVNTDPTNADFAKIKMGNTRIDFLGGFQQPVRLAAQLYENKLTSSTTGKTIPLGTGFAKTSRYDVVVKFLQGKFSPVPSLVVSTLKGQDFTGAPVKWSQLSTWERAAGNNMIPFLAQDLYNLYTTSGPNGLFAGPLDLFGVGVQSYKAKTPTSTGSQTTGGGEGYWGDNGTTGSGQGYWGP